MGLQTTLLNSSNALNVFEQEFSTIQNNIANANTPGYAAQNVTLVADSFLPSEGLYGGLSTGPLANTRSEYLEKSVRAQTTLLGSAQQQASDLAPLRTLFDLSSATGVSGSLNSFFNSFSALSVNPNDAVARQNVITQAQAAASSFNQAAAGINSVASNVQLGTNSSVSTINQIAADLASINQRTASTPGGGEDAGLSARINTDLENLSQVANFTVLHTDGQVNVYLGGQTPIVLDQKSYSIATDFSTLQTILRDSQGNDITSQITGGQLGSQIQENNVILPGYRSSLNALAQTFADTVNNALAQGVDQSGNPPANNLFTYNAASNAALTLGVTPGFTASQIAAALATAPGGNGNALAIAQLANAPTVSTFTFTQAFGNLGQQVGADILNAKNKQTEQQSLVTQAQAQRAAVSGVSYNSEAAKLLEFQQAFTAVSKVVTTLNAVTTALMNMVP